MIIKCKMCGGDLNVTEGLSVAECEYCGSRQTIPSADNEKKMTLFNRAGRLLRGCEFDKAAGIFETIVADFPEEAEAYWGLVLCKYGIEYVDDPATGKKVPTCHRSSFESIMEDSDFEQTQENADVVARKQYREEAKQIEELRKGIIAVSANEQPYEIFICYKETDVNGDRTLDSVLAQDIYDALTGKGYRVFFSRITLEDKLGTEYEPYIFAALNSAKIMLAVGTDYEHYNAVWVKNEWSRYLKLMAQDKTKHLIPCFKNLDAYDMPKEFARLQAQDLGKVGAMQDLLRGIEKILQKRGEPAPAAETAPLQVSPNTVSLLQRASLFLEDEKWSDADAYCEKVLDIDPKNPTAYLYKLMAQCQVSQREELKNCKEPFDDSEHYKKVIRFGDPGLIEELKGYIAYIVERNQRIAEQKRLEAERIAEQRKREAEKRAEQKRLEAERMAEQKRLEAERMAEQRKREAEKRAERREIIKNAGSLICAGEDHTVGLKTDGNAVAVGENNYGQCNVFGWRDIAAVSAGYGHTVALKTDNTVVAVGYNYSGQCDVSGWTDIAAVSAGHSYTVGLKTDGTVVAVGRNDFGRCVVSGWTDIVAISVGLRHTVGLKTNNTVVAVGYNDDGRCDVSGWKDIVAVSAGGSHTVGLKTDGTVVAVGSNKWGQCKVSGWVDIVAISAGTRHTIGLKTDGTVVAVGDNDDGECDISDWRDIAAVSAGEKHTVGLKSDGTVVAVGKKDDGQCAVSAWKLFRNLDTIEQERQEQEAQQRQWREENRCQYCGGAFKGLLTKKCASCGSVKDY